MGKRPYPIERDIERWRRTATRPDHIEQPGPGQESGRSRAMMVTPVRFEVALPV